MTSYVVTGAARGLGLEFVKQLSNPADNVVFALVRNKKTADNVLALSRPNVHILEADITDVKALKLAAGEVAKVTGGKLDVLINNAAFIDDERNNLHLDEYPEGQENILEDDLRKAFNVNVIGVIHTINVFLPLLHAGVTKKVITISSGRGDIDFTLAANLSNAAPYSISKAAVNLAVAKYATEHKKDGFVFLALSPGSVITRQSLDKPTGEDLAKFQAMVASFRKLYPDFSGPITPEESVTALRNVIENATVENTGTFISYKGNKEWL